MDPLSKKSPSPDNRRVYVSNSAIHGRGVFASRPIRRGQKIGTFEWQATKREGKYVLWVEQDDGSEIGCRGVNDFRYLNHSSKPNAEFDDFDVVALKNIKSDDEILIDYGW